MPDKVLRLPEVLVTTGLSRSTLYNFIAQGAFPLPLHLGRRAVGWLDSEVSSWIAARASARPTEHQRRA